MTKIIIIAVMFTILYALGSGLYYLVKDESKTNKTAKALSIRIAISLILFIFLFIAFYFGWLQPHTI